ncbi:GNAT family N-acetyltransferase [Streptomyces nitrosporeus]|uniref:GNAT family N-acetyltransferase n=1 Tax=Streptomyces nitrosporeus TaxID=28894 RepID=A0A5J6F7T3_9ACTN|nr:GNAT family N-acetyltransferase [Streptomyces nitrosporeus]QEU72429.1 GNAT family N-acetyltransferase [Streptomyces nitrosporeus]GGY78023.1 N-acetyltransferase [Streptomyces nitrosporeus]
MDVTIERVHPSRYAALGELTALAYLDEGLLDLGADDPYLERLRAVARRAEEAEVLVALDEDGTLLGGVTYTVAGGPWADIARPGEAEFRMLAVSPGARGRGTGEALVRACIDRARAADGVRALVLSSQRAMLGAHRLYRRLGFVRTPERDWAPMTTGTLLTFRLEL